MFLISAFFGVILSQEGIFGVFSAYKAPIISEGKDMNNKLIGTSIVLLLALSMLAGFATLPHALALETTHDVYEGNGTINFDRVYCTFYDGMLGEPKKTVDYPDVARVHIDGNLWTTLFGHIEVDVYRHPTQINENNQYNFPQNGIWIYHDEFTSWGDYQSVSQSIYDDLCIDDQANVGLTWCWPYAEPQFSHYKWQVQYWVIIQSFNAFDECIDQYGYWTDTLVHDERSCTGTLYNYIPCPEDTPVYGGSVSWTEEYPSQYYADVSSATNALGSEDGNYATLSSWGQNGAMARLVIQLDSCGFGPINVRVCTPSGSGCNFYVYTSYDGSNWNFKGSPGIGANSGWFWQNVGDGAYLNYVMLIALDQGAQSTIYVDAVKVGVL